MLAVILGRRRQGKSTLALSLARSRKKTIIVFDPNDQFNALPVITDVQAFMETSTAESVARIVPGDPLADWEQLAAELDGGFWRWGEYVLILDEASMLMSPYKLNAALERYARTSPKDVDLILTTHRMVDIHNLFRSLATDWYIFHQHLDRDLELIADNMGADVAARTMQLANYHLVHFWLAAGGLPEWTVWDRPRDWYIDIGRIT